MTGEKFTADILSRLSSAEEVVWNSKNTEQLPLPSVRRVRELTEKIQSLMFPTFSFDYLHENTPLERLVAEISLIMNEQIKLAFLGDYLVADALTKDLLNRLSGVKEMLLKDADAIYEGDPAANSPREVILSYPGFYAIMIYRVAHEFYLENIPYIPRIMTEYAHEKTGIDIHPGASVGERFCIDHGTGIVIGETTVIGDRVKIYQGVTLGAKSFELGENGKPIKGKKRHPNIGNDCVIYANATILGGDTKIGDGCTIGGNVWLTNSVSPGQTVYYRK